jgi:hypothetical protein
LQKYDDNHEELNILSKREKAQLGCHNKKELGIILVIPSSFNMLKCVNELD